MPEPCDFTRLRIAPNTEPTPDAAWRRKQRRQLLLDIVLVWCGLAGAFITLGRALYPLWLAIFSLLFESCSR